MIYARNQEVAQLRDLQSSEKAEFLAVYGRRRVGKTFLLREYFSSTSDYFLMVTGKNHAETTEQLQLFEKAYNKTFTQHKTKIPFKNWSNAFDILIQQIQILVKKNSKVKIAVVFDELPWLATNKSGLLGEIESAWNTELQYIKQVTLVVCGSAASWMLTNVIQAKGGLHNRITSTLRLQPFSLSQTKEYLLKVKKAKYNDLQILEIYMAFGGIPYYLSLLDTNLSASQNIGNLFFGNGQLRQEFENLFSSLFENSKNHKLVVKALASKKSGLTRNEILKQTKIPTGGSATKLFSELEEGGFTTQVSPIGDKTKEAIIRLTDAFCYFHWNWLEKESTSQLTTNGIKYWLTQQQSGKYAVWAGYAFENVCIKHVHQIQKALGFESVNCTIGSWYFKPNKTSSKNTKGAQIDLVFDRADRVVTICEMKFYSTPMSFSKKLVSELTSKIETYKEVTKTNKQFTLAVVTPIGLQQEVNALPWPAKVVTLENLISN